MQTDVIELDGLYLGAFWIELSWSNSRDTQLTYQIVADDPHPAAHDSSTTHPHVSNQTLCEGEGSAAIKAAPVRCLINFLQPLFSWSIIMSIMNEKKHALSTPPRRKNSASLESKGDKALTSLPLHRSRDVTHRRRTVNHYVL